MSAQASSELLPKSVGCVATKAHEPHNTQLARVMLLLSGPRKIMIMSYMNNEHEIID